MAKTFESDVNNIQPRLIEVKKMRDSGKLSSWSDPSTVLNGLKSGGIALTLCWDGRTWSFIDSGNSEFTYYAPKPGVGVAMTWTQTIKHGSPLGYKIANVALSKDAQSCFGSAIRYGIANKGAVIDPNVAHEITPTSDLIFPFYKKISELEGKWIQQ